MRNGVPSAFAIIGALALACAARSAHAQHDAFLPIFKREQTQVMYHDPGALPPSPSYGADYSFEFDPPRLSVPERYRASRPIGLDEAIELALKNVEVVRTLNGNSASTTGRTIYDAAIQNNEIDSAQAAFDPTLTASSAWIQNENPGGTVDPSTGLISQGNLSESHNVNVGVNQRNMLGGEASFTFNNNNNFSRPSGPALNPSDRFFAEVNYTQPLLRGAGVTANRVPIMLARINAERSFFQFRGSMQDLVRGVVEGYWGVVAARTDLWAREKQIEQATAALERAEARLRLGISDITEVTQARSALANFKAQRISSEGTLLNAEAALLNILGMPPASPDRLVPTSPPASEPIELSWTETFQLAEQRRPDIIEQKLIWEADVQRYLQSKNQFRPTLNASARYRWDGLTGTTPFVPAQPAVAGIDDDPTTLQVFEGRQPQAASPAVPSRRISTSGGEFADWQLGINFSVPLFLRQERANLRSAELVLARDRANIKQTVHAAEHTLARLLRQLDQSYLRYKAFQDARAAARLNLERQLAAANAGTDVIFLNVLQAISDWGNSVSQEASALLDYNTTLARIEQETGTILETHGIWFVEDQRCNVGPMWIKHERNRLYPHAHRPTLNEPIYESGDEPAEEFFDLEDYPGQDRDDDSQTSVDPSADLPDIEGTGTLPESKQKHSAVLPLLEFLRLR